MTRSAPIERSRSSLSLRSTPVTSAPKCLASWTAKAPIPPPAPMIRTFRPRRSPALRRKCKAPSPPVGTVGLVVRHVRRLVRQRRALGSLRQADVLGIGTEPYSGRSEHLVPTREVRDRRPHLCYLPGELLPQDFVPRPHGAHHQAHPEPQSQRKSETAEFAISGRDCGRMHLDQQFIRPGDRSVHVLESKDPGGPVLRPDHCPRALSSSATTSRPPRVVRTSIQKCERSHPWISGILLANNEM